MLYGFLVVYYLLQLFKFDGKIWLWAFIAIEAILLEKAQKFAYNFYNLKSLKHHPKELISLVIESES